ncbi:hypothetical protein GCM10023091_06750 [Ravibacter arvi]|uniref:Carbohydrate binding protein with CBM9 domain n=1 Tax=Ravibacter arvi TaxID=2051041 RepID=A0ABP8LS12_9BACT
MVGKRSLSIGAKRLVAAFVLAGVFSTLALAQKPNAKYRYHIFKATSPIQIDGVGNDPAWSTTEIASDFFMMQPMDTSFANAKTDVRLAYDEHNLYILVENHKPVKGSLVVESLKRDFSFNKNDNFLLFMDPYDDRTNGFSFGSNAAGAPWDGQQVDGGTVDLNWENRWYSAVKNDDEKWVWEAAIPFKSIRYKDGLMEWGINFSRLDLTISEKSSWAPVPRQFASANLAYTGVLVWDRPPPKQGLNISVIPYAAGRIQKNYQKETPWKRTGDIGGDVKIGITPSLNLDLTVNPDFSQVDVDVQQTNLDRFELFFPERRQFFLENADIFANFGYANLRPFFSRRIGLGMPIQFGARLSGKIDKNWRIGVLDTQTSAQDSTPVTNYGVVAVQRRVFARSNVRLMMVNKQAINYQDTLHRYTGRYNRNFGAEFNLASANNLWTGKLMAFKSVSANTPEVPGQSGGKLPKGWVHAADLSYNKANFFWQWQHELMGEGYNAEVGYTPNALRGQYAKINPSIGYLFFVKSRLLISHGPKLIQQAYWDKDFKNSDNDLTLQYHFNLRNRATAMFWGGSTFIRLLSPFDPSNSGRTPLPAGSRHSWKAAGFEYVSEPQRPLTYSLLGRFGGYYENGNYTRLKADLGGRVQPYLATLLSATYTQIRLPHIGEEVKYWLVGPRIDVTFTNTLFLTTFLQYNSQMDNVNLNTRFQWRFKPASDFFLVYTDNYLPENFRVKNRALVLKCTYWLNM